MASEQNMVLRTVYLPKELDRRLRGLAFRLSKSKGELMRDLILDGLEGRSEVPFGDEERSQPTSVSKVRFSPVVEPEPVPAEVEAVAARSSQRPRPGKLVRRAAATLRSAAPARDVPAAAAEPEPEPVAAAPTRRTREPSGAAEVPAAAYPVKKRGRPARALEVAAEPVAEEEHFAPATERMAW